MTVPDRPLVSVVMAVFNGEAYLAQAMDSVLAQSLDDWELVLIDDGSTDQSRDIIRAYTDPRIRLIENQQNLGLSRSLNRGLRAARGQYIARQDADDLSEPDRLLLQSRFLEDNPEVALVGSWYTEIAEDGRRIRRFRLPTGSTELKWALLLYCPFVHSAAMFRLEPVLTQLGGYREDLRYSMDYELWSRIAARFRVANLPAHLVRYRVHGDSMSSTFGSDRAEGSRLRAAAVSELLGWGDSAEASYCRWEAMAALLLGWADAHPAPALKRAAEDLLRLQGAVAHRHGVTPEESAAHRADLTRRLGERLILQAASRLARRPAEASSLARAGLRLRPAALLHHRVLRKSVGRFCRSVLAPATSTALGSEP